jgi:hypothetical protein
VNSVAQVGLSVVAHCRAVTVGGIGRDCTTTQCIAEGIMPEVKNRIRVRTVSTSYVGDLLLPSTKARVTDAIDQETRQFICLTNVLINDQDHLDFLLINKNKIESVSEA